MVVVKSSVAIYCFASFPSPHDSPSLSPFSLHPWAARAALAASASSPTSTALPVARCRPQTVKRPAERSDRQNSRLYLHTRVIDIDSRSFDLPIAASRRSIIRGFWPCCSAPLCKMAASKNNIVGGQQRHSGSSRARNYSAVLPRLGNLRDAVFDRCQRRMLMMESVGWYAHQLRDTHPPLVPPLRLHDANAPFWHWSSASRVSGVIHSLSDGWKGGKWV